MTEIAGVQISKPDKELIPGTSKQDLAAYYGRVATAMLPYMRGRPVNMQRFPDALDGGGFYEKKVPSHFPDWVTTVEVDTANGRQRQVVVDDARALVYLAQQACITPHTWLCTDQDLDRPDQLVFDLDPSDDGPDTLASVRRATRMVGRLLEDLGLPAYLKTTGSRGYHVLVPIRPELGFDDVRDFARRCAEHLVEQEPGLLSVETRKASRGHRVYIDVLRNGYGQTVVPPYAVRARPGAPVSTPLEWSELSRVAPRDYTTDTILRRLAQREDPWAGLRRHAHGLRRARRALA